MNRLLSIIGLVIILVIVFYIMLFSKPILKRLYPLEYEEIIIQQAENYQLDPLLIAALINVESRWKERAVSREGAIGLMQLMPDTATWISTQMGRDFEESDLFDPIINIELGCWYLNYLQQRFISFTAAVAAYNGGEGNVSKWLANHIWEGTYETVGDIPFGETRNYVQKITYTWNIYQRIYTNPRDE